MQRFAPAHNLDTKATNKNIPAYCVVGHANKPDGGAIRKMEVEMESLTVQRPKQVQARGRKL